MSELTDEEWEKWFEKMWAIREEEYYPVFFGEKPVKFYNLPQEVFLEYFGMNECHPAWLSNIVLEYAPTEKRGSWLYVTSGLSNPIGQEPSDESVDELSGLGMELIIEANERSHWPIHVLQRIMAYQILVATTHIEGALIDYGLALPFGEPITKDSPISNFLIVEPEEEKSYPIGFRLPSGVAEFMILYGITDDELESIPENEDSDILERYAAQTAYPITEAFRGSIQ